MKAGTPLRLVLARLREGRALGERLLMASWLRHLRAAGAAACAPWRPGGPVEGPAATQDWLARFDTPGTDALAALASTPGPAVRVVMDLCHSSPEQFRQLCADLGAQAGVRWCAEVRLRGPARQALAAAVEEGKAADTRFTDSGPQDAVQVVLRDGIRLRRHALRVLADAVWAGATLAYCDETALDEQGRPCQPWFKPAWSPLLLRQHRLLGACYGLSGTTRVPADLDETHFLAGLAALPRAQVVHLPYILFHHGSPPLPAPGAAVPPLFAPAAPASEGVLATVIIPTRNRWDLLGACLASLQGTRCPPGSLEILVVDNGSDDPVTLRGLEAASAQGQVRVLHHPGPFNYARLNNLAANAARGELLVLLNNDTEVRDPDWLGKLAAVALAPGVGAAGCKLLFADGSVQHAGIVLGMHGTARHVHLGLSADAPGWQGLAATSHEVSALTGACLAVRRSTWLAAGGMDERLPVTFNDIMFCLDLAQSGWRNVYLAEPLLFHHESRSRGIRMTPAQRAEAQAAAVMVWQRHPRPMAEDPCYSPCLSLRHAYEPAAAPRRRPVWQAWKAQPARVLLLAGVRAEGGLLACLQGQAAALQAAGAEVLVGAVRPPAAGRIADCQLLRLHDPATAMAAAVEREVDVVVVHGAPFFGMWRECGRWPAMLACDHGPEADVRGWPGALAAALERERQLALGVLGASARVPAEITGEGVTRILAAARAAGRD